MSEPIIRVQNIAKQYLLGTQRSSDGLRHVVHDMTTKPLRWLKRQGADAPQTNGHAGPREFWALSDVSFDIKQGEAVGIIGRNGAGKSTMLKILSRITEPTRGRVEIRGRVASLLEVGTGFHPELSGRENIFLNGAILGMRRSEIRRKFDEIVAFAEVEQFLDTPVKRYSSGMYVRLAFAVAAHLEPEILIVDEVLAVGDAQFQQKCLGKMQDVATKEGRTVLFVSHNMAAVNSLTQRVVLLKKGHVEFSGPTAEGVARYLSGSHQTKGQYTTTKTDGSRPFISKARIQATHDNGLHVSGEEMKITFEIQHPQPIKSACFSFQIINQYQQPILHCWIYDADTPICRESGSTTLTCRLPRLALNIGSYSLNTYLSEPPGGEVFERLESVCEFDVEILGGQTLFGWRPDACAYIEDFKWSKS
jgi:ABC-type polysaccharide/polyol phosphate transport system ATPase subunit